MASKIRELKDTLVSQNTLIASLQRDNAEVKDGLKGLYTALVQYKVDYTTQAVDAETSAYPELRNEDLATLSKLELLKRISNVFGVVVTSVSELRAEVVDVYKELDADVDAALDTWRQLSAQGAPRGVTPFRADTLPNAPAGRTQTPELVNTKAAGQNPPTTLPPTPPSSVGKTNNGDKPTGQQKVVTTPLGKLASTDKSGKIEKPAPKSPAKK